MSKYLWVELVPDSVWHMVSEGGDQTVTLCGLELDLVESQPLKDEIGRSRPCDNCTKIAAIHEDAGDQPDIEGTAI